MDDPSTPAQTTTRTTRTTRNTTLKRDSLTAELERDPQFSAAKRQHRTQVFNNSLSHASLERQLLAERTARIELETKLREKELQVNRLERDRRYFADREQELSEERDKERNEYEEEKRRADAELRSLRTTLSAVREELADLNDSHSTLSRSTSQTISSQKSQIASLSHQVSLLEQDIESTRALASSRESALQELQEQLEEITAQQDTQKQKEVDVEGMDIVRTELQRQTNYLRTLENSNARLNAEVTKLRERQTSAEVLREEKHSLENKLRGMEEMRNKVASLEAELNAARREREEWASRTETTPSHTPIPLTQTLSDLRLAHASLLEQHGATNATLRQLESSYANLQAEYASASSIIDELKRDIRELNEQATRKESRAKLAEREVAGLNALLASYSTEATQLSEITLDASREQRIRDLETLLDEYKAVNAQLMEQLNALPKRVEKNIDLETLMRENVELKETLQESQSDMQAQLEQIDNLEQELFDLRGEIAGGRHVPSGVRVLEMADNPERQWFNLRKEVVDKLREENDALLKRLKDLEDKGVKVSPPVDAHLESDLNALVPRASLNALARSHSELEDQLKQKEKRLLRLQQVFTAKSAEFREAIASILGVKLAFYPNGGVRVTSVFDLGASFVFQPLNSPNRSGGDGSGSEMKMQLVAQGEGGPQDVPSLMAYWIDREQCIPGFMASITLECYEKWKSEDGKSFLG